MGMLGDLFQVGRWARVTSGPQGGELRLVEAREPHATSSGDDQVHDGPTEAQTARLQETVQSLWFSDAPPLTSVPRGSTSAAVSAAGAGSGGARRAPAGLPPGRRRRW